MTNDAANMPLLRLLGLVVASGSGSSGGDGTPGSSSSSSIALNAFFDRLTVSGVLGL